MGDACGGAVVNTVRCGAHVQQGRQFFCAGKTYCLQTICAMCGGHCRPPVSLGNTTLGRHGKMPDAAEIVPPRGMTDIAGRPDDATVPDRRKRRPVYVLAQLLQL